MQVCAIGQSDSSKDLSAQHKYTQQLQLNATSLASFELIDSKFTKTNQTLAHNLPIHLLNYYTPKTIYHYNYLSYHSISAQRDLTCLL